MRTAEMDRETALLAAAIREKLDRDEWLAKVGERKREERKLKREEKHVFTAPNVAASRG